MKVLTFSRHFPKGHPKAGQPTWFVEKILLYLVACEEITIGRCIELARQIFDKDHPMCSYNAIRSYACKPLKCHTIRTGSRWKVGDMASLRVWSDKPYRSKQIEFAQVEVKKVWAFTISDGNFSINTVQAGSFHPFCTELAEIAKNDGLEVIDFINWFNIHPKKKGKVFSGQIICWDDNINYSLMP